MRHKLTYIQTWSFWQTHDVILKSENGAKYPTNIISETGWPSQGGNDCGTGAKCATKTEGAVAGISELNEFMDGWVCQSMANGTTYFWFEAFDVSTPHLRLLRSPGRTLRSHPRETR
jgi:exo-beta-1,3-glucanase (GH17 family)